MHAPHAFPSPPQGTDSRLTGHFTYSTTPGFAAAPPLRCTNRTEVCGGGTFCCGMCGVLHLCLGPAPDLHRARLGPTLRLTRPLTIPDHPAGHLLAGVVWSDRAGSSFIHTEAFTTAAHSPTFSA